MKDILLAIFVREDMKLSDDRLVIVATCPEADIETRFYVEDTTDPRKLLRAACKELHAATMFGVVNQEPKPNLRRLDEVHIIPLETNGRVDAIMQDECGWQYRVIHWVNGERRQTWLYEWEIRAA